MAQYSVLLATQGTYPYSSGGVSTWCDILCTQLHDIDFTVYALVGMPQSEPLFVLPPNVRELIPVPMWGMQEPTEYIQRQMPFRAFVRRKYATSSDVIEHLFIPLLVRLLEHIFAEHHDQRTLNATGTTLYELWRYFQHYDWNSTWKSERAWEAFLNTCLAQYSLNPIRFPIADMPSVHDISSAMRSLHHHLMMLNAPVPRTDIVHSTLAGFAGIVGVIAKHAYGTPLVVTEHGIFVREQYMAVSSDHTTSPFFKRFMLSFSNLVCKLMYLYADCISPVCDFNARWEREYGAASSKIHRIYNSVDAQFFVPQPKSPETAHRPTVTAAARVFPLKDLETMIRSAALVRERVPDVQYIVYGATGDEPEYYQRCLALVERLNLRNTFTFYGLHPRSPAMYTNGDITMLSSMSEAFPFAVLESMSCGRPVVATDVGGIREVLEGFGLIVPPRNPEALADAAVQLLLDDAWRAELGKKGREQVLRQYQAHVMLDEYRAVYTTVAQTAQRVLANAQTISTIEQSRAMLAR
jgi:glycosyltransferase involved in cell wall biosynthesis